MRTRAALTLASVAGFLCFAACVGDDPTQQAFGSDAGSSDASTNADTASDALGDAATSDAANDAGRAFLYVFVTANTHVGQFPPVDGGVATNGLSGADAFCQGSAESGSIPVLKGRKWVAWLSIGNEGEAWRRLPLAPTGARDLGYEYRLHDGATVVFPAGFYLGNSPADGGNGNPVPRNAINLDENHAGVLTYTVWTGTAGGDLSTHPANCLGWNAAEPAANNGLVGSTHAPGVWTHNGDLGSSPCTASHSLYCFEVP